MSVQRTLTRLLLKLPDGALRALSGGGPVELGGRTLDPHFQFIAAAAARRPPASAAVADVRAATDLLGTLFGGAPEPGVAWRDEAIALTDRSIPIRVYRPAGQQPQAPVLVYFHFGGGVVGRVETCHAFCTILAATVGCPVVSVEYRLAPEHPWPAGLQDALDAYDWARANAARFGAPAGAAAAGGDSMGGNFTAILAQEMRRRGAPQPFVQLLIYPATDIASRTESMTTYGGCFPLTADTMAWFMSHYLPPGADPADVRLSPLSAEDVSGLAPALIATAGFDPLVDQGAAYARRLEAAGVSVKYDCYDALAHGFTAFTGAVPAADAACRQIARDLARAYRALGG